MRTLLIAASSLIGTALAITVTNDPTHIVSKTYDYVIVGAGTAGLALANRLATNSNSTVLVLESGVDLTPDTFPALFNPADIATTFLSPNASAVWTTVPQCAGRPGGGLNSSNILHGNCTGGSSAVNGMMDTNGASIEYDSLASDLGNSGWNWAAFLRAIKSVEKFTIPDHNQIADGATYNLSAHGTTGFRSTEYPQPFEAGPIMAPVMQATSNLFNLSYSLDGDDGRLNGVESFIYGVSSDPSNPSKMTRVSSRTAFISPFMNKLPNLTILTAHTVASIDFNNTYRGQTATCVHMVESAHLSKRAYVNVGKEVIVTSGTFKSPGVLLRSGVGPQADLQKLKIPVVINLPGVGKNYVDQPYTLLEYASNKDLPSQDTAPPSASTAFVPGIDLFGRTAFQQLRNSFNVTQAAQQVVAAGGFPNVNGAIKLFNTQFNHMFNNPLGLFEYLEEGAAFIGDGDGKTFSVVATSQKPFSRGTITLPSTNPLDNPIVDPKMFLVDLDMQIHLQGVKMVRKLHQTPPLASEIKYEIVPNNTVPVNAPDSVWEKYIVQNPALALHAVGSMSMLPQADGGVVSPQLIVYGTTNVRVADLSIIPYPLVGHTQRTATSIGVLASQIILGH